MAWLFNKSKGKKTLLKKKPQNKNTPIEELRFVILDTETTGLDRKMDKVLSIGALAIKNYQIEVGPCLDIQFPYHQVSNPDSISIHGIIPTAYHQSTNNLPKLEPIVQYLEDSIIVGHHIKFDVEMLNRLLFENSFQALNNKYLDTAALSRRLDQPKHIHPNKGISLDRLCNYYKIQMHERHTALGDAYLTALVFMHQLKDLERKGIKKYKDLWRKGPKHYSI